MFIVPLLLAGCNNNTTSSESSINSVSSSSSAVIDYGTVKFDNIYLYPDGYDGVKIRPYFSNE